MRRRQLISDLPLKTQLIMKSSVNILFFWLIAAFYLFLSGEAIFILPAFFIGIALFWLMMFLDREHIVIRGVHIYLVWSLCLALFSFLSANYSVILAVFPILCLLTALALLIIYWRKSSFFTAMHTSVWLVCIGLVFFFGWGPVGLIAISASILLSIIIHEVSPHSSQITAPNKKPEKEGLSVQAVLQSGQQGVNMPVSDYTFQVPGQQYQPLLPEYDSSYGAYIQDLPQSSIE